MFSFKFLILYIFCSKDAHNAILKYDTDSSLFAVYDGHGGHEVAKYCSQNLPNFIKQNEDYRQGNIDKVIWMKCQLEIGFMFNKFWNIWIKGEIKWKDTLISAEWE